MKFFRKIQIKRETKFWIFYCTDLKMCSDETKKYFIEFGMKRQIRDSISAKIYS